MSVYLTEKQFLTDVASYAHVKQHEQETTLMFSKIEKTRAWAEGNKKAWGDFESILNKRLDTIKLEEEK